MNAKTLTLAERLTAEAKGLHFVSPQVVVRDGVASLLAGKAGLPDAPPRHVAFLGLARAGYRRLSAELRRVAAATE